MTLNGIPLRYLLYRSCSGTGMFSTYDIQYQTNWTRHVALKKLGPLSTCSFLARDDDEHNHGKSSERGNGSK